MLLKGETNKLEVDTSTEMNLRNIIVVKESSH